MVLCFLVIKSRLQGMTSARYFCYTLPSVLSTVLESGHLGLIQIYISKTALLSLIQLQMTFITYILPI